MQSPEIVTLNDVLITAELQERSPRLENLQAENQAMRSLVQQMTHSSETVLQSLVNRAVELCQAGSAGVSLLETSIDGTLIFRWNAIAGRLSAYVGGTTPRHFSPCGVCLDQSSPQLFSHPERYFTYFAQVNTPIVEGLVLPLIAEHQAIGTIWIMSHDPHRHFDLEDVRIMTSLADFTAAALLINQRQTRELLAKNAQLEAEAAERKLAESQWREAQTRLQLSLTGANLGAWTYNINTDEFWADDRAKQIHGHDPHEVHTFQEAGTNIHPEDRDRASAFTKAIQTRSKLQIEYRVIWRDGSIHWIASHGEFISTQDAGMFYGVVQDISDRHRRDAERGSQMKDEFLAMVSHELQSPLVAILGWTRLLRVNLPDRARLLKHLETIERNAMLQAKLVQDLLDVSRITAGKLRLNVQPVELKAAIKTAIAMVTQTAQAKEINLIWQVRGADQTNFVVMADLDRLQQIIGNLLTNAVKFTPAAGSVTVELSRAKNDNASAVIRIADTGIGISAEFLPHIFDRFRQAEKSGSAGGVGLGLAIAHHLVELHHGTIEAESIGEGQGATFTVKLPLLEDSQEHRTE